MNFPAFHIMYLHRVWTSPLVAFLADAFRFWRRSSPGHVRPATLRVAHGKRTTGSLWFYIPTSHFLVAIVRSIFVRCSSTVPSGSRRRGILKLWQRPIHLDLSLSFGSPCGASPARSAANLNHSLLASSSGVDLPAPPWRPGSLRVANIRSKGWWMSNWPLLANMSYWYICLDNINFILSIIIK